MARDVVTGRIIQVNRRVHAKVGTIVRIDELISATCARGRWSARTCRTRPRIACSLVCEHDVRPSRRTGLRPDLRNADTLVIRRLRQAY
jgi:hypothetical protein